MLEARRLARIALLALLSALLGSSCQVSPVMPSADVVPTGSTDLVRGIITFGVAYDPTTLTVLALHLSFALGARIAWSAALERSPGSKSVALRWPASPKRARSRWLS